MKDAGYIDIRITFGRDEIDDSLLVQDIERIGADTGDLSAKDIRYATVEWWSEYPDELLAEIVAATHGLGVRE